MFFKGWRQGGIPFREGSHRNWEYLAGDVKEHGVQMSYFKGKGCGE